jgi:hypothetical protein
MNDATSAPIQSLPEIYLDKKAYRDPSLHAAKSEMLATSLATETFCNNAPRASRWSLDSHILSKTSCKITR